MRRGWGRGGGTGAGNGERDDALLFILNWTLRAQRGAVGVGAQVLPPIS